MHNIVMQLKNSWYSGFDKVLVFIFGENEDSVALRCFALWGINLFLVAKNEFRRIFMVFQKKKIRSKRKKKIILDMIQGQKGCYQVKN